MAKINTIEAKRIYDEQLKLYSRIYNKEYEYVQELCVEWFISNSIDLIKTSLIDGLNEKQVNELYEKVEDLSKLEILNDEQREIFRKLVLQFKIKINIRNVGL